MRRISTLKVLLLLGSVSLGAILSGCQVIDGLNIGNYDKDVKTRCEDMGGRMKTSQDKHGAFVYCLFPDNTHCAESVVRSANCQPGKWPLGQ